MNEDPYYFLTFLIGQLQEISSWNISMFFLVVKGFIKLKKSLWLILVAPNLNKLNFRWAFLFKYRLNSKLQIDIILSKARYILSVFLETKT